MSWARIASEGLLMAGPVAMGVLSFPTFAGLAWAARGLTCAAGSTIAGWAGSKGCGWLLTRRRKTIDVEHSAEVSASLRSLHAVVREGADPVATRKHLLTCITRMTARVCPQGDAEVFACLLLPEGNSLRLMEFSNFRDGRVPSAQIACGTKRTMTQVADTSRAEDAISFVGKSYRCILSFPLLEYGACVGAVAIDSTMPSHPMATCGRSIR